MRHRKAGLKLGRTSSHRTAMFRNMVTSLLKYGRIQTTDVKAKELKRWTDNIITLAKRGDIHARRQALSVVREKDVVHKLFAEAAERFGSKSGGYTRIVKLGRRPGDAAPISLIELITAEKTKEKKAKKKKSTRAPKRPSKKEDTATVEKEEKSAEDKKEATAGDGTAETPEKKIKTKKTATDKPKKKPAAKEKAEKPAAEKPAAKEKAEKPAAEKPAAKKSAAEAKDKAAESSKDAEESNPEVETDK